MSARVTSGLLTGDVHKRSQTLDTQEPMPGDNTVLKCILHQFTTYTLETRTRQMFVRSDNNSGRAPARKNNLK